MDQESMRTAYRELCTSYRAIDDFRTKLLGLLPLATAGGIFVLISDDQKARAAAPLLWYVGAFGAVTALGLFCYELYGIRKCTSLIKCGQALEGEMGIAGQFTRRPPGVGGMIDEVFAAGVIYPAVLAAWVFVAVAATAPAAGGSSALTGPVAAPIDVTTSTEPANPARAGNDPQPADMSASMATARTGAFLVFGAGFAVTIVFSVVLKREKGFSGLVLPRVGDAE